ncbi:hypothetical protein [Cysteiniphilum marinum]|uniref:hypothetical protein n=1 Tax=Cysteiniphilum marinum TaxID=2774191 RepID=UPI00193B6EB3|nr:hypothetical protein [Cysteiniphilum marinum]
MRNKLIYILYVVFLCLNFSHASLHIPLYIKNKSPSDILVKITTTCTDTDNLDTCSRWKNKTNNKYAPRNSAYKTIKIGSDLTISKNDIVADGGNDKLKVDIQFKRKDSGDITTLSLSNIHWYLSGDSYCGHWSNNNDGCKVFNHLSITGNSKIYVDELYCSENDNSHCDIDTEYLDFNMTPELHQNIRKLYNDATNDSGGGLAFEIY